MERQSRARFGILLRHYRLAQGLTQEQLADHAGLSTRAVVYLERGARAPFPGTVRRLAAALHLDSQEHTALTDFFDLPSSIQGDQGFPVRRSPSTLIGRERELILVEDHQTGNGPPVLLLAGEPGIGKSRMLRAAAERAGSHTMCVLQGSCRQRGSQEPYAPLVEALKDHIQGQAPTHLHDRLLGCGWLVRLLPELVTGPIEPLPDWKLSPEQERRLIADSVIRYLTNTAEPAGTLLVLDDIQWAGPDALDLLSTLARATASTTTRLRIVAAYRTTELHDNTALALTLSELAQAGLVTHCALGALSQSDSRRLLDQLLETAEGVAADPLTRIVERTGGVPFFLVSYADELRTAAHRAGRLESAPWTVAYSIRQRVAALPVAAQELLNVAALIGRVAEHTLLAAVTTWSESAVIPALEAICRANLLVEYGPDSYRFAHDVIREVVESNLSIARRTYLHRRIGYALELLPGELPIEALAYHFQRGDQYDRMVFYLEEAGDRALAQGAQASAAAHYRALVDRRFEHGEVLEGAAACEKLGFALSSASLYDEALAVLLRALHTYERVGEPADLERISARIAWSHFLRGTWHEALRRVEPLLALPEENSAAPPRATKVKLQAVLMHLHSASGRFRDSVGAADRTIAAARAIGEVQILADAEGRRGASLVSLGDLTEGRHSLERSLDAAVTIGDLEIQYQALYHLARCYMVQGELIQGKDFFERAIAVFERLGDPARTGNALAELAYTLFLLGDWARSRRESTRALDLMKTAGPSYVAANPRLRLGQINLAEGRWADAVHYLEEASAIAERIRNPRPILQAQTLLAEYDLRMGRPDAAYTRLVTVCSHTDIGKEQTILAQPHLAWVWIERGDVAHARALAEETYIYACDKHLLLLRLDALWQMARATLRLGDLQEARRIRDEGLSMARRMQYPFALARFLQLHEHLCAQRPSPELEMGDPTTAEELFRRLGAAPEQL
jgi:tetratricopeptide (TPR) repeat protein/transcriptional regulator with XRE-family HTH domain